MFISPHPQGGFGYKEKGIDKANYLLHQYLCNEEAAVSDHYFLDCKSLNA